MDILKRKLPNGKVVGYDTSRNCYCPLPKALKNAPFSQPSIHEMTYSELKDFAAKMELDFKGNISQANLLALVEEAMEAAKGE